MSVEGLPARPAGAVGARSPERRSGSGGLANAARAAADAIRRHWAGRPRVALILGTGLGSLASAIDEQATVPYSAIPRFPRSTALSHRGRLVCGDLNGTPVVAMEGRCHLYEGYDLAELMLPIYTFQELGVRRLVISNASGGLNPQYRSGDVMVLRDHINLMFGCPRTPAIGLLQQDTATPISAGVDRGWLPGAGRPTYCPQLIELALRVSQRGNFAAHRGVYVAVSGPNYETRAEYRFLRRIGGDAVGMSTVPEAIAAAQCGLRTIALSVITNIARPDAPAGIAAEDVVWAAAAAEPRVRQIALAVAAEP